MCLLGRTLARSASVRTTPLASCSVLSCLCPLASHSSATSFLFCLSLGISLSISRTLCTCSRLSCSWLSYLCDCLTSVYLSVVSVSPSDVHLLLRDCLTINCVLLSSWLISTLFTIFHHCLTSVYLSFITVSPPSMTRVYDCTVSYVITLHDCVPILVIFLPGHFSFVSLSLYTSLSCHCLCILIFRVTVSVYLSFVSLSLFTYLSRLSLFTYLSRLSHQARSRPSSQKRTSTQYIYADLMSTLLFLIFL